MYKEYTCTGCFLDWENNNVNWWNSRGSGDGQLGIGTNKEKGWVCVVKALEPYKVRSVVAGSRNSLAICDDSKVPSFTCLL